MVKNMDIKELTRDQLTELKLNHYAHTHNKTLSYEEMAAINEIVTDGEIFAEYSGVNFVPDDFFISADINT